MHPSQASTIRLAALLVVGLAGALLATLAGASAVASGEPTTLPLADPASYLEAPSLRLISDEDRVLMQQIKRQVEDDFADLKTVDEAHAFLDKVRLLVMKHPRNVAFAQGDLKDLQRFLSQEIVTRLLRLDTDLFAMPIPDDKVSLAQRAVDEDELTRKVFGGPLRSLIEAKRQLQARSEGNHRDTNFFSNFWCKISGNCSN